MFSNMESIPIVDHDIAWFQGSRQVNEQQFCVRRHNNVKASLPYGFASLKAFSSGGRFTPEEIQNLLVDIEFQVEIMIPAEDPNGTGRSTGVMKIYALEKNDFLKEIWKKHSGKVSLSWHFTDFICGPTRQVETENWRAKCKFCDKNLGKRIVIPLSGVEMNRTQELKTDTDGSVSFHTLFRCMKAVENLSASTISSWRKKEMFHGHLSIFLNIEKSPYQLAVEQEHFSKMGILLEQRVYCDLKLVTLDAGISVKCHRAILSNGSGKLARLLEVKERRTKLYIMSHYSADCVKAFLAFIYQADCTKVFSSTYMTLEVLQAAVEFEVVDLVARIQMFLSMKPNKEFTPGQSVILFGIVKTRRLREINDRAGQGDGNVNADNATMEGGELNFLRNEVGGRVKRNAEPDGNEGTRMKRICDGHGAGFSGSSRGAINENVGNVGGTTSNSVPGPASMMGNMNGSYENCLELLEARVIQLIEWFLKNKGGAIRESFEYKRLMDNAVIFRELTKVFIRFYQAEIQALSDENENAEFMV